MGIIIGWIIFSFIIGLIGIGRKIGFFGAFFLSLLLSPVIGLIITLVSKNKDDEKYNKEVLANQKMQNEILSDIQGSSSTLSISDELEKIIAMKDSGILSEEDFQKAKAKLLSN